MALVDSLEAKEFAPVWQSENIPADRDGGFGSPVVADGKLYVRTRTDVRCYSLAK